MSKLFIGTCLLAHAASAGVILAFGSVGMWVALGIMLAALVANIYYRRKAKASPLVSSARTYMRAKADLIYATFFMALAAGWLTEILSQGLAGAYYLLPLLWAGMYVWHLLSVRSDLKWAAELEEDEAEDRALRAEIEAAQQNGQN